MADESNRGGSAGNERVSPSSDMSGNRSAAVIAGSSMDSSFRRGSLDFTPAHGESRASSWIRPLALPGSIYSIQVSVSTDKRAVAKGGDR